MPTLAELLRNPHDSELDFFRKNPTVGGMASEDNRIVMNPYSTLSPQEQQAVQMNEGARIRMRQPDMKPGFDLTDEQRTTLDGLPYYKDASDSDRRATIAARQLSGDPTGGKASAQQSAFVQLLRKAME